MDFTFKMVSVKSGWMEIEAICQEQSFLMRVCEKSDPLDELLDLLIRLNDLCSSGDDFSDTPGDGIYLFWEGMDSQYTLKFTPLKERIVKIGISYCENTNAGIHIRDFTKISGEARLDTLISALGLSTRARNALERANAITVRDLLNFPIPDIHMMRGVGNQTRQEILRFLSELRQRFPHVEPAPAKQVTEPEVVGPPSLEVLHQRIIGVRNPKQGTEWNIRTALLQPVVSTA